MENPVNFQTCSALECHKFSKIWYFRNHFSVVKILQQQIFILQGNMSDKIPNSEIIVTPIGPDAC